MKITSTETFIQAAIIRPLVRDLLAAGFYIDVNSREETELSLSRDSGAILDAVFNPEIDEDRYILDCFTSAMSSEETSAGFVLLIDGNGATVISDYSVSLEAHMVAANALAGEIGCDEAEWLAENLFAKVPPLADDESHLGSGSAARLVPIDRAATFVHKVANLTEYKWPEFGSWCDDQAEDALAVLNKLITEARAIKAVRAMGEGSTLKVEG